ncbi:histidine--tRNA ligase [Mycoplasma tullyi]|uniref:Histidine--tRNA ligase n=1 Tax=Mycoplasma tullyi TaxID=1612150 RepID=A0A7D7UAM0_9MOLU|nr:histidine--tRNA ligase [Mycoplasma tullyi]QMT98684.1 histidine--tRNA ligase [Mycoplasma tullyi]
MSNKQINAVRGTTDWFDNEMILFNAISNKIITLSNLFTYQRIKTPVFEHAELFSRNLEHSDIVKKELYQFVDRSDRKLALRPEGTASIIRAVNEHKLLDQKPLPLKLYYLEPMFRYERPQKGRMREFYQYGIEFVGELDQLDYVQTILFAKKILDSFNFDCVLNLNWLGNFDSRKRWVDELNKYFNQYKDQLSELSVSRLNSYGVLRILDDKNEIKKDFVKSAPTIDQFISSEEQEQFKQLLKQLDELGIKYEFNPTLVRGLDYYSELVFEFIVANNDQAQSTLIGGGCYQNLIEELTNKPLKAIGFALSIERFISYLDEQTKQVLINQDQKPRYLLINLATDKQLDTLKLSQELIDHNYQVYYHHKLNKLDKAIKYALRANYTHLIIMGNDEWNNQTMTIKDLTSQTQQTIKYKDFIK